MLLIFNMIHNFFRVISSVVLRHCGILRRYGTMSCTHSSLEALYVLILLIINLLNNSYMFLQANEYHYFCGVKVSYLWQRRKYLTMNAW